MLAFVSLSLVACKKEAIISSEFPIQADQISERGPEGNRVGYYLDGDVITREDYTSLSKNYYYHDYITSNDGGITLKEEFNAFSDRDSYENWGQTKGIDIEKMIKHDLRVDFLADSLGITNLVLSGQTPSPSLLSYYESQIELSYNSLIPSAPLAGVYAGCKFWTNNCNPDMPGNNCNNASAYFLPITLSVSSWVNFFYVYMEDNSEAWEPLCTYPNVGGYKVTLRPYSYPFYVTPWWQTWPKKVTVNIPSGSNHLFVPFNNGLNLWKNRISSWIVIPSI